MADSTTRLGFEVTGNVSQGTKAVSDLKTHMNSELASISSAANKAFDDLAKGMNKVAAGELSMAQQLAAAASLQRQRSAALVSSWRQQEKAAADAAKGTGTFKEAMQDLNRSVTSIQGPMSGIGSRVSALTGLLTSGAISVTAAIGATAVGVAALTVGIVAAGEEIFDATKKTAEWQGKFLDLSQQVGVAVETLSTLDVIASTTGGSIESVTASLGIFQKNLEASHDPTSKESKLLKDLGVTSLETETALRQTIKGLFAMGEGAKQTDAVLQLFGRGGKFVNAILKESKGDLDAATAKFEAMGIIVGGPAAAAADAFNDSLVILQRQLAAVSMQLTQDSIPVFTIFFQDLSSMVGANLNAWASWGEGISRIVAGVLGSLEGFIQWVQSNFTLNLGSLIDTNRGALEQGAKKMRTDLFMQSEAERFSRMGQALIAGHPGDTPGKGKGAGRAKTERDEQYKAELEASKEAAKKEEETQRHLTESLKLSYEENKATTEEYYKGLQTLSDAHFNTLVDEINRDQKAVDEARERGIAKKADLDKEEAAIELRSQKVRNDSIEADRRLKLDKQKALDKAELDLEKGLAAIRETARAGELERINALADKQTISESAAIAQRAALEKQAQEDRTTILDIEMAQLSTSADRKIAIDLEKGKSEQEYTDKVKALTRDRIDAMIQEQAAQSPQFAKDAADNEMQGLGARIEAQLGPPPVDVMAQWHAAFADLKDIGADAFHSLANGIGNMVENYVLLGTTGPAALKKLLAATLAQIAAESAVKAIYWTAQGIVDLFFNPARAATDFAGAAMFASIAGVSALAGRAIAGDSFKSASTGGGASAGSGAGGSSSATNKPSVTDVNRNVAQPRVDIHITRDEGSIVKVIQSNYRAGGEVRDIIHHALGDPGFAG